MKKGIIVTNVFVASWIVFTLILIVSLSLIDFKLGTKIGAGLFYIKGHYKEMTEIGGEMKNTIVTEQGPGIITVPLGLSLFTALIAIVYLKLKKKDEKITK
ncbi:hypothetical protein V7124_05055 [Neobacillus niacini]|uniref:hypothetical protein n=1 Tax=Neobacillus niacini TaxID=86668 RepID=UPI002FFE805D